MCERFCVVKTSTRHKTNIGMFDSLGDLDAVNVNQPRGVFQRELCDWAQDSHTVSLFFPVGPTVRAREFDVKIKAFMLHVARRTQPNGTTILAGSLPSECDPSESEWELEKGELRITLRKKQQREWMLPVQVESMGSVQDLRDAQAATAPSNAHASTTSDLRPVPSNAAGPAATAKPQPPAPRRVASATADTSPASGRLSDKYREWDRFDDIGALASVENAGKSADEPGFRLSSSKGVAAMQCTEYVKDREEIELDEELTDRRGELQQSINERLAEAAELKSKGNSLLTSGRFREALNAYITGVETLGMAEHARVLLSARLENALSGLLRDLRSNAAAAALKISEWQVAVECATAVLQTDPNHIKALFRRASAYAARGDEGDSTKAIDDLDALLKLQPQNSAARKLKEDTLQVLS